MGGEWFGHRTQPKLLNLKKSLKEPLDILAKKNKSLPCVKKCRLASPMGFS